MRYFLAADPTTLEITVASDDGRLFQESDALAPLNALARFIDAGDGPSEFWADNPADTWPWFCDLVTACGTRAYPRSWPATCFGIRQWRHQLGNPTIRQIKRPITARDHAMEARRVHTILGQLSLALGLTGAGKEMLRRKVACAFTQGREHERLRAVDLLTSYARLLGDPTVSLAVTALVKRLEGSE